MTLMRDEILEQPTALERVYKQGLQAARNIARRVNDFRPEYVLIAARGSSDNAATYARYVFEAYTGLPVSLAAPSLFTLYKRQPNLKKAWVIGISQSGRSEDIVEVVNEGRKQGAFTLALTNDPESPLAQTAAEVLPFNVGTEKSVAATKTYTAELVLMALLASEISDDNGLRMGLDRLPASIEKSLQLEERLKALANTELYKEARHCLTLGRGYNFSTALELALKLKETCYVFAAPYSTADFLHGPFALAEQSLPAILVGANGPAIPGLLELGNKLTERGVEIVSIGDDNGLLKLASRPEAAFQLDLTGIPEALSPVVCVVPGQLFALHLALARGYNPDEPRGLRKVTITR
ncbi:MAG TPA: SIS domain-containing protein [Chloroflexia bacterium]|nr:SIS domain-containing protein [Chloroflexia bacterium]